MVPFEFAINVVGEPFTGRVRNASDTIDGDAVVISAFRGMPSSTLNVILAFGGFVIFVALVVAWMCGRHWNTWCRCRKSAAQARATLPTGAVTRVDEEPEIMA